MNCLIVVLNWRAAERTLACVESLVQNIKGETYNLIIADNSSGDGSLQRLIAEVRARYPEMYRSVPSKSAGGLYVIDTGANGGYAFGNNEAVRWAHSNGIGYDAIWIVNNDTVIKDNALQPLLSEMRGNASVGFVGSYLLNTSDESLQCAGGVAGIKSLALFRNFLPGRRGLASVIFGKELAYITGASMLVSKALISDVGLMDESFFLYFEEAEWQERSLAAGYSLRVASDSRVYHEGSATVGHASPFFYYMYSRSAMLYLRKINKGSVLLSAAWLMCACYLKTRSLGCIKAATSGIKDGILRSAADWRSQFFVRVNARLASRFVQ